METLGPLVAKTYLVDTSKSIGRGSFGLMYAGKNVHTNEESAFKLENVNTKHPQLLNEFEIYCRLQGGRGIPSFKWYGREGDYNFLVTDLLGSSLDDLHKECGCRFSLKTVLMLAGQMLSRLEFFHSRSYIHRDVKPENFLMGKRDDTKNICYIIDYGLSKQFQDPKTGIHIPNQSHNKSISGTVRYLSMNGQKGNEQSRRDDLESLGYTFMFFLRGSLPWQGIRDNTKQLEYQRVLERKQLTVSDALCKGYPKEFQQYFQYCQSLEFEDVPDYAYLKKMFRDLFEREGFEDDGMFDWVVKRQQEELKQQLLLQQTEKSIQTEQTNALPSHNFTCQKLSLLVPVCRYCK